MTTSRALRPETGNMLRRARARRGLTMSEIAGITGTATSHISNLENARRAPSVVMAKAIIRSYRLEPVEAEQLLAESVPDKGRSRKERNH